MKKILPILFVLLFLIPTTVALAESPNLTLNKVITIYSSDGNIVAKDSTGITDMQNNTLLSFFNGHYTNLSFDQPYTIDSIYLKMISTSGTKFSFYKDYEMKELVGEYTNPLATYKNTVKFENVKAVKVQNKNSSPPNNIYDFALYGIPYVEDFDRLPVNNLTEIHNHNSTTLSWFNPSGNEFVGTIIKQNGEQIKELTKTSNSFTVNGLTPDTSYVFEIIAKYSDGTTSETKSITFVTNTQPVDITPPSDISNLSVVKTHDSANFVFTNPIDTDFSHIEVYRDGNLINDQLKKTIFNDVGLVPNTSYVYRFVAVDVDGNKSAGFIQTVLTDSETDSAAPAPPININAIQGNGSGRIVWKSNVETDLQGYNLYINGAKYNSNLILSNNYVLNALTNGEKYSITVTAVDTSGNESLHSNVVILNPSESAMPLIESKFDLKAVADGTNNWFMSLWPILAFSVGITLAFLIARRVKMLFFA